MTVIAYFQVQTVTHCCMQSKVLPKVTSSSSRLQMALLPQYGWHWILISHNDDPSNWLTNFILRLQVHKWPLQVQQYLQGSYSKKKESLCFKSNSFHSVTLQTELHLASAPFPVKNITQVSLRSNVPWLSLVPPDWWGKSNADTFIHWPRPESIKKLRKRLSTLQALSWWPLSI